MNWSLAREEAAMKMKSSAGVADPSTGLTLTVLSLLTKG